MAPILELAERHGIGMVEDAALAAGARYHGRRIGSLSTLTAFSTAPGKILDGVGSGGMVATDERPLYDRLNTLRHYGREQPPYRDLPVTGPKWPSDTIEIGYNERLDTIHAAVLQIRLPRLDERSSSAAGTPPATSSASNAPGCGPSGRRSTAKRRGGCSRCASPSATGSTPPFTSAASIRRWPTSPPITSTSATATSATDAAACR